MKYEKTIVKILRLIGLKEYLSRPSYRIYYKGEKQGLYCARTKSEARKWFAEDKIAILHSNIRVVEEW